MTDDIGALRDRGGVNRDLVAITVQDLLPLGRLTVAPSLRWELRQDTFLAAGGGALPPPATDLDEDNLSGKIGSLCSSST